MVFLADYVQRTVVLSFKVLTLDESGEYGHKTKLSVV